MVIVKKLKYSKKTQFNVNLNNFLQVSMSIDYFVNNKLTMSSRTQLYNLLCNGYNYIIIIIFCKYNIIM